ncbi:glycosyltransferase family 2 protein [Streptomyces sp. ID05-47C]|uniref:glycosyltransferase family 2 protein n=1 Tax=Streptomyces sp. ID05-47C TaxID=3028665 RepID=UPI0029A3D70E|nr:glycosyltransferase family 2 protein [Streptomyces sp. ID05-47C]MDX3573550.1 glycosyltransferase family 2 protein [Streptomyces sp. ID05-47C]
MAAAGVTLWWMLHAWRTPETLESTAFAKPDGRADLSFSLLVPARHEEAVLRHTVEQMLRIDHPDFEILLIVGHDDPGTAAIAHELSAEYPDKVRTVVDTHAKKNKPRALNTALPHARGEVVGVFDAEDVVHPELLSHVDFAFRRDDADVVQGGVQLINYQSSWYSLRNCLEYFFWFRSRLHLHARKGFIPLGGNTVFVRSALLRDTGGWDGDCLAEDCDLGVRLSSGGAKVVVAYHSALVTREETPDSIKALYKQRTRWNQGFLQVLRKGEWRQLPGFGQRMLARYTLSTPFVQAATGVMIPLGLLFAVLGGVPLPFSMFAWLPMLPMVAMIVFEAVALHDFGREYGFRITFGQYAGLILLGPVYAVILAGAALRAVWREYTGRRDWELTSHVGAHLPVHTPQPQEAR